MRFSLCVAVAAIIFTACSDEESISPRSDDESGQNEGSDRIEVVRYMSDLEDYGDSVEEGPRVYVNSKDKVYEYDGDDWHESETKALMATRRNPAVQQNLRVAVRRISVKPRNHPPAAR